ncbi:MAG: TIM barrel protein [Candidatus Njordarchaeales archaeon]
MQKPILDWGTYNALGTLPNAMLLGMRLTEIPPRIFSRKAVDEKYFREYYTTCKGVFTTITAHAPYYSLTSEDESTLKATERGMKAAIKYASIAGAEIFNLHIGSALDERDKAIEMASEMVKKLLKEEKKILISLETTYSPKLLGSIEDIRAIIEATDPERVIISLQLDNDFIRENKIYETGNFTQADAQTNEEFWYNLFMKALPLSKRYFSLRFSQVVGLYLRKRIFVKRRVPFGRGYPHIQPLARALARFLIREIYEKERPVEVHIIYTGPPQTKYVDTVELYHHIIREVAAIF